ncbi:MAG: hypothetical protein A3F11_02975 [Gammaproteobacteria bacterium RIFCSPHIGHO2_12_FULL_37_14]|nr:MAG: hypothetical protein A3F11_02975 [Gammaproteobacteria bacterium RIFCSPHIGHO2_12_FULL_37_14]
MKQGLVITSISPPNKVLKKYVDDCRTHNIDFFLIGDTKSPADFLLPGCNFWSVDDQEALPYTLSKILPKKNYARKNIGYLLAMHSRCDLIIETDDDNYPKPSFYERKSLIQEAFALKNTGWTNVYRYFSNENIWPRGFPLRHIKNNMIPLHHYEKIQVKCPIQQGLADENPDVDAIYRLINPLPHVFVGDAQLALANNSWCPFNSQNTVFFKPAFPLMYLPSTCNFRQTDIWRSFIAQRIAWENNWHILFTPPTVYQDRNEHDLMADFADEIEGYLFNEKICQVLGDLDLQSGEDHIQSNMILCYQKLIGLNIIKREELDLLTAWFNDLSFISIHKNKDAHVLL